VIKRNKLEHHPSRKGGGARNAPEGKKEKQGGKRGEREIEPTRKSHLGEAPKEAHARLFWHKKEGGYPTRRKKHAARPGGEKKKGCRAAPSKGGRIPKNEKRTVASQPLRKRL